MGRTFVHSINTNKDLSNGCMSGSENSNDSGDLVFSTTDINGKKNARRTARMKTRHVSTSSATSIANGNSQPSPLALAHKPKKSIMKTSRLSQDEDEEVSFSDSATVSSQCNGSSRSGPANSKIPRRLSKHGVFCKEHSIATENCCISDAPSSASTFPCNADAMEKANPFQSRTRVNNSNDIRPKSIEISLPNKNLSGNTKDSEFLKSKPIHTQLELEPEKLAPFNIITKCKSINIACSESSNDRDGEEKNNRDEDTLHAIASREVPKNSIINQTSLKDKQKLSSMKEQISTSFLEDSENIPLNLTLLSAKHKNVYKDIASYQSSNTMTMSPVEKDDLSLENMMANLEEQLSLVNGSEVPLESLKFSFESDSHSEEWYKTFARQDKGEEILYYPEPMRFLLPCEMPIEYLYPFSDEEHKRH